MWAISGTRGSSGLGSVSMEQMERRTVLLVHFLHSSLQLTFADGQGWAPLVTQNVQTDAAIGVDVWVVYAGGEVDLWWLEGIICWKVYRKEEYASAVA
jgi:hypothetical protein